MVDLCWNTFDCVVVDEGVRMKGEDTLTGMRVRQLDPRYRLVLTATPVKNRLTEREEAKLEEMDLKHLATGQAYQIRLELQSIYNSRTEDKARERWQDFLGWVRRKADRFGKLLEPMRTLADTTSLPTESSEEPVAAR